MKNVKKDTFVVYNGYFRVTGATRRLIARMSKKFDMVSVESAGQVKGISKRRRVK